MKRPCAFIWGSSRACAVRFGIVAARIPPVSFREASKPPVSAKQILLESLVQSSLIRVYWTFVLFSFSFRGTDSLLVPPLVLRCSSNSASAGLLWLCAFFGVLGLNINLSSVGLMWKILESCRLAVHTLFEGTRSHQTVWREQPRRSLSKLISLENI
jgi:hypothetical protein